MWSFLGNKGNKQWIWIALNSETREIIGLYVGNRSSEGAQGLWASIPEEYKELSEFFTDHWAPYNDVLPHERHHSVGKETGKTSYIERFNNTMRQRCSRLVRKTLSFSKKIENHIGAIWYFIRHYNSALAV
jgi:IS1 family transposase